MPASFKLLGVLRTGTRVTSFNAVVNQSMDYFCINSFIVNLNVL